MSYVRVDGIECASCGKTHDLAVPLPAYAGHSYVFDCPTTKANMLVSGIPVKAREILQSVPKECVVVR